MHRVLLTGSSGSIGTRVAAKLTALGYDVRFVDILPNRWIKGVAARTQQVDLTDAHAVASLPTDVDCIIHLAAHARIKDLIDNPRLALENVTMTAHILEFVRRHHISKIIFASSREVYGEKDRARWTEDCIDVHGSASPYAASKVACEALIEAYAHSYGTEFVTLRFSNAYGRYDTHNRIVPLIIAKTMRNEPLTLFGEEKTLDFCHLDDIAESIVTSLKRFDSLKGEAYNIGSGIGTKLTELVPKIHHYMQRSVPVTIAPNRVGEMQRYIADTEKARAALGFQTKVSLDDGLSTAVAWYTRVFSEHPEYMPR